MIIESLKAEIKIQQKVETLNINHSSLENEENTKKEGGELGTIKEENSLRMKDKGSPKNKLFTKSTNKIQIMSHFNPISTSKVSLNDIPNEFFIKNVLFFLDVHSLPKFGGLSKKTNECLKIHMIIRVFFLNKEKQLIEKQNEMQINTIEKKRKEFFDEYEIQHPLKENALEKIKALTYYVIYIYIYLYFFLLLLLLIINYI